MPTVRSCGTAHDDPGPGDPGTGPAVDLAMLRELSGEPSPASTGFLQSLVSMWEIQTDQQLVELEEAVGNDDPGRAAVVVHSLKGASASVGATELARRCADLEHDLRSGRLPTGATRQQLRAAADDARAEFAVFLATR